MAWGVPAAADGSTCAGGSSQVFGETVVACGTTVLAGDTSGAIAVQVPRDTSIDLRLNGPGHSPRAVDIEGSAPFAGLVVYPDGASQGEGGFFVGRYIGSALAGESAYTAWPLTKGTTPPEAPTHLSAGRYWLQLIASGDTRVAIRFQGLDGTTELVTSTPTSTHIVPLTPRSPQDQNNLYWTGASRTLDESGFALIAQGIEFDSPGTIGVWGDCFYPDQPPEDIAYLPGCPSQLTHKDENQFVVVSHNGAHQRYQKLHRGLEHGSYGLGIWHEAVTVVDNAAAIALWISLVG